MTPPKETSNGAALIIKGKDNYGKPKQDFADKLANMTESDLRRATESYIWLSAYAANNLRSDYHWQCDACYDEARRRGDESLYQKAWEQVRRSI